MGARPPAGCLRPCSISRYPRRWCAEREPWSCENQGGNRHPFRDTGCGRWARSEEQRSAAGWRSVRITGVIQAGGKSARMGGSPKAPMRLGGHRLIERVLAALTAAVDEILVVTNSPDLYAFLGVPMVSDAMPDHGSLGGIYTGLREAPGEAALTVACDMPFVLPDVMRLVAGRAGAGDVVIPRVGGQLETLHALYAKSCLPHIAERLEAGQFKVAGFFDRVRVVEIPEVEVARFGDPAV